MSVICEVHGGKWPKGLGYERFPLGSGKELRGKHHTHEIRERESEHAHSPGGAVRTSGSQLLLVQARGNPRKIVLKKDGCKGTGGKSPVPTVSRDRNEPSHGE